MTLIKITQPEDSPLPCAIDNQLGGCRQIAVQSSAGLLDVVLCPSCYDEVLSDGNFMGKPIVETQDFVLVDSTDRGYVRWLKERA